MSPELEGAEALDFLFWKGEILQALYWMQGEGLAETVDSAALARFLVEEPALIARHIERLTAEGYLEPAPPSPAERKSGRVGARELRYRLTPLGLREGGRSFQDEFAELTQPGHGECAPGCWCHNTEHAGEPCPSHPEHAHGHTEGR